MVSQVGLNSGEVRHCPLGNVFYIVETGSLISEGRLVEKLELQMGWYCEVTNERLNPWGSHLSRLLRVDSEEILALRLGSD